LADPPVLPGVYGIEQVYPSDLAPSAPVGGIVFRLPLGRAPANCDRFLKTEDAMNKLRKAQEMFELGLIEEDALKKVAAQTYAIISQP